MKRGDVAVGGSKNSVITSPLPPPRFLGPANPAIVRIAQKSISDNQVIQAKSLIFASTTILSTPHRISDHSSF
jgi:hypothetical protein